MNKKTNKKKRSNTIMETIEKKYGKDFGASSNQKIINYLNKKGYNSLSEILKSKNERTRAKAS